MESECLVASKPAEVPQNPVDVLKSSLFKPKRFHVSTDCYRVMIVSISDSRTSVATNIIHISHPRRRLSNLLEIFRLPQ